MFHSIRSRILMLFVLGLVLVLGTMSILILVQVRGHYTELFRQRGLVAAELLGQRTEKLLSLGLQLHEFYGFENQCREIVRSHPGVSHAALADAGGRILYASADLPAWTGLANDTTGQTLPSPASDPVIRKPVSPGEGRPDAQVLVVVDRAAIDTAVNQLLTEILLLAGLSITLGIALMTAFLRLNFDRPAKALLDHIRQVDPDDIRAISGQLSARQDEIGTMAGAFDLLVEKLLHTQQDLRAANRQLVDHSRMLEARVSERTRELHRLAHTDVLTQLPNRRYFMDLFRQRFAHANRHDHSLAVVLLDLNGFKQINDGFGHAAGDRVLETMARRVSEAVRGGDTFSRLGGDEFALLVEEFDDPGNLRAIAEKISDLVAQPVSWNKQRLVLSASIGIAVHDGDSGIDAEGLLGGADAAMYRAKRDALPFAFADGAATPGSDRRVMAETETENDPG